MPLTILLKLIKCEGIFLCGVNLDSFFDGTKILECLNHEISLFISRAQNSRVSKDCIINVFCYFQMFVVNNILHFIQPGKNLVFDFWNKFCIILSLLNKPFFLLCLVAFFIWDNIFGADWLFVLRVIIYLIEHCFVSLVHTEKLKTIFYCLLHRR